MIVPGRRHRRRERGVPTARVRDQLIALEIRARSEEWRRSDIVQPRVSRALRRLQEELRRGIWRLGLQAALEGERSPTGIDPLLLLELRAVSQVLRRCEGDPHMARILVALDETTRVLETEHRPSRAPGPYRTPAVAMDRSEPELRNVTCMACTHHHGHPRRHDDEDGRSRSRGRAAARGALFVALAWGGMAAAAAGLRWLPAGMALMLVAWLVGLPEQHRL